MWNTLSPGFSLRPASPDDVAFLIELYIANRQTEFAFLDEPQRMNLLKMQYRAQEAGYISQFPESEHFIILQEGKPVGRIWLARTERELRVIDISLLQQHRRQGIGGAVYRCVLSEAAATKKVVVASVLKSNLESLQFHARHGFSVTGGDDIYYTVTCRP